MERPSEPFELIERFLAGDTSAEVVNPLRRGLSAWFLCGGEVSLERCLHFPNTPHRVRLAQRNAWIRRAASLMKCRSSHAAAAALESELYRFVTRGRWAQLQDLKAPPEGLSTLTVCLFHISRLNDGETLSSKQIHRVIRREYPEKCPPDTPTIEPVATTPGHRQLENRC